MLALVFLLCGSVFSAAAASSSSTNATTALDELKTLLNSVSYNEYISKQTAEKAESEFVIGIEGNAITNATYYPSYTNKENKQSIGTVKGDYAYAVTLEGDTAEAIEEFGKLGGIEGALYTPSSGTVEWDLTQYVGNGLVAGKLYGLIIEYYPVVNKSASIERVMWLNGDVPFSEARGLVIPKIWENVYAGKIELPEGQTVESMVSAATAAGIEAASEVDAETGKTYITYKIPADWTWDSTSANFVNSEAIRFFTTDIDENEIRASLVQAPEWATYNFKDSNGFRQANFEFVLSPDDDDPTKFTFALESVNEPMVISSIRFVPVESTISYEQYTNNYAGTPAGTDKIKIEAEYYAASSSQTIYPVSDSTSAVTSPSATDRTVLNTVGGDKWQNSGQWIEYKFKVNSSGMYRISTRFKQSVLDGMYTSRALYIYSDGIAAGTSGYYNGIPFTEAANIQFNYSSDWQSGFLSNGAVDGFDIYFEAGVEYTVRLEVTLGNMGTIVQAVQDSLESINKDYLNILKLTGSNPDSNRDYGFSRVMPDTKHDLLQQARNLQAVAATLEAAADSKSSMTATLEKVATLLEKMGQDDDEVAKNLEQLKTYIGSLGTWLSDAKTQPLTLDYIIIQPSNDAELPEASAGFFKALWFEIKSFIGSFFRNYNRMGAMKEVAEGESVEVWLAYGRDQTQVIRSLINNDFTPQTGIAIDLKLVASGTLLPSILSGMGPDCFIGIGQNEVINYAIRGALLPIGERIENGAETTYVSEYEGFAESIADFNDAAMEVLGVTNAEGRFLYYGLPETQNFTMMFVREDIFAELDLQIPETWAEVKEIIPVLQANNMQIGMTKDENIFLYQLGGTLFADDGMRINLDSNVALEAFNTMCEMFTMYSFPYKYDFPNRFRTGEMPIGFATYTSTYNQLKVFATEIEGLWSFYPLPGYMDSDGVIHNESVSTVTGIAMIKGCENTTGAWKFMQWHADDDCQIKYANEMVALLGPSAKHATANVSALESLPWTEAEYTQLERQFGMLAAIPNYPGRYIVERYTQFAFLSAFNDNADPVTEMQSYIKTINTEITRKRAEFGLETLEDGQTLAQKRMWQAEQALNSVRTQSAYSTEYDDIVNNILNTIKDYVTEDYDQLRTFADALEQLNKDLFGKNITDGDENYGNVIERLRQAADSLEEYERDKTIRYK